MNMQNDQKSDALLEQIIDAKYEIKQLNETISDLNSNNTKLRNKIDLSKDVLNNYESTIEKLHRQIEYLKIKGSGPDGAKSNDSNEDSNASHNVKNNAEDRNVVQKLLNDIESLRKVINQQCDELAHVHFENDKLLNLYQNKDKVLNDKRNELVLLQANYDDLYEQYKIASNNENLDLEINDENVVLNLLKITQKEKEDYRQKLKDSERSLKQLRIEYYIMEERQGIYKRE